MLVIGVGVSYYCIGLSFDELERENSKIIQQMCVVKLSEVLFELYII